MSKPLPVPLRELLGKTATQAQAIVDAKRRESGQECVECEQGLAEGSLPVHQDRYSDSKPAGRS